MFQDDSNDYQAIIHFASGTLDTDIDVKPNVHIYTESKANWLELTDDLPKHQTGRDSKQIT